MYTDSYNVSLTLEGKCTRYRNLLAYLPFERCSEISSRGEVMNDTHVFKRHIQTHCFEIIWIIQTHCQFFRQFYQKFLNGTFLCLKIDFDSKTVLK